MNIIPELYAVLGNYNKAKELYLNLITEKNTLLSNARVYGFSNLDKFTKDSLDYKIAYTNINTPYNDYNAVLYKEGLVFESNRVNKIYKKKKDKINELRILKAYLPIMQQKVKDASSSLTRAERQLRLEDVLLSIAKIKSSNE